MKVAVLPLIPRNEDIARRRTGSTRSFAGWSSRSTTTRGQIGRRYRRQDEIGTPFALTIDEQTLEDDTVTIRDRDSLEQERIPIAGARAFVLTGSPQDWQTPKPG